MSLYFKVKLSLSARVGVGLVLIVGYGLLTWVISSMAWRSYSFWKHGIEKTAFVVKLDRMNVAPKSGSSFDYRLNVDGRTVSQTFRVRLPEHKRIAILVLPEARDEITIGDRDSSLFRLFATDVGGGCLGTAHYSVACVHDLYHTQNAA